MRRNHLRGFTLIEVLIVVVIMAVLAATIIPQFTASTTDAKNSTLEFNLHSIRSQIEMYRMHHLGAYPVLLDDTLPQMLKKTNAAGNDGTEFGPYLVGGFPKNPFNSLSTVAAGVDIADGTGGAGWKYNAVTGAFWPDNTEWTKP